MTWPPSIVEFGLIGILGVYLIDKGTTLIYKLARKNGNNKITKELVEVEKIIATLQANQVNMAGVVAHIESEGSIRFQVFEEGNKQWKKNVEREGRGRSKRIDLAHTALGEVNKQLADLLAQHKMNHPSGGGRCL